MRRIGKCSDTCEGAEEAGICFDLEIEAAQQEALDLSGTTAPRLSDLRHHRHCAKERCALSATEHSLVLIYMGTYLRSDARLYAN